MPRAWFQVTQKGKTMNHCKQHFNNFRAATASRKLRLKNDQGFMISVSNKEAGTLKYYICCTTKFKDDHLSLNSNLLS